MSIDVHYKLLRLLESNPEISQREIAKELDISLGKANYCLRALVKRGWVKAANSANGRKKAAYLLTPRGIEEKANLAMQFLQAKMREYDVLRAEIKPIRREVDGYKRAKWGVATGRAAVPRRASFRTHRRHERNLHHGGSTPHA